MSPLQWSSPSPDHRLHPDMHGLSISTRRPPVQVMQREQSTLLALSWLSQKVPMLHFDQMCRLIGLCYPYLKTR